MAACAFFGLQNCPDSYTPVLRAMVEELIVKKHVDRFYIGNQGNFDHMAKSVVEKLQAEYPHIRFYIVLSYLPTPSHESCGENIFYPQGIENVPKRLAVSWRNKWMVLHADYAVAFVPYGFDDGALLLQLARKRGKTVINIASC